MSEAWNISDGQLKKLKDSPILRLSASSSSAFPEAARVSDSCVVHFASHTTYTLGKHQSTYWSNGHQAVREVEGVQIFSGSAQNIVTGEAAKALWVGLLIISADWRKLSTQVSPSNKLDAGDEIEYT